MKKKILALNVILLLIISSKVFAQVPYEWPIINSELTPELVSINHKIDSMWNVQGNQGYCSTFAGDLLAVNSNRGYSLFNQTPPGAPNAAYENYLIAQADTMLIMMNAMGYKSVDITISYPILVNGFPNRQVYLDFYKKVYAKARARGFKIIENCQVTLANGIAEANLTNDIKNFYYNFNGVSGDTIKRPQYESSMAEMMQTVIDSLTPDYLTLEMEPQTQADNMFHLLSFAADSTLMYVNYFINHLQRKGAILYGAGAGSWNTLNYFQKYATTAVDYLDYHVYPINGKCFNNTVFQVDSIAKAYNKKIIIGECGLHKESDSEYVAATTNFVYQANLDNIDQERSVFNYFEGIDTLFQQAMINLSQQAEIELVDFFDTEREFGYLTWNTNYDTMSVAKISKIGTTAEYNNMYNLQLGALGRFTKKAISHVNCTVTGIGTIESLSDAIRIYPNPFTSQTTISFSQEQTNTTIKITDILGKEIKLINFTGKQCTIEKGTTQAGIYFVQITSFDKLRMTQVVENRKVVVQ